MRRPASFAVGVAAAICVAAAPSQLSGAVSDAYAQNGALASYTFQIHGVMAMRGFPWLHFHFAGYGKYVRGVRYVVHLTQVPFFARAFSRVDLSALAPSIWPRRYVVSRAGSKGNDDLYSLLDPHDKNLRDAIVQVDPTRGIREITLSYNNGSTVDLSIQSNRASGYLLPNAAAGQIGAPVGRLAVTATFDDYDLLANGSVQTSARGNR
jgi:hypothetical protein